MHSTLASGIDVGQGINVGPGSLFRSKGIRDLTKKASKETLQLRLH